MDKAEAARTTEYELIRSDRRTLSLEITRDAGVLVRAPWGCPKRTIDAFVAGRADWIAAHLKKRRERNAAFPEPTEAERRELIRRAVEELPPKVAHYAAVMGLEPSGISVTGAERRFGSCSPKNRLCFSWRLMRYPEEAVDYVVVHELAHIAHKDHGPEFYALIASVMPDHKARRALLRR